ncbi:hypothetical protein Pcinc_027336 [Petrolisthes cinctipes]|uniref:Uncharacterized protein n=1 Tax=Petrolisthes cinctipes TaxID=88211 RepID=A0AAE1K6X9_PETCI|nr:hypothetical protein Pcinc_027336 [Petrolisthes cinctipes]
MGDGPPEGGRKTESDPAQRMEDSRCIKSRYQDERDAEVQDAAQQEGRNGEGQEELNRREQEGRIGAWCYYKWQKKRGTTILELSTCHIHTWTHTPTFSIKVVTCFIYYTRCKKCVVTSVWSKAEDRLAEQRRSSLTRFCYPGKDPRLSKPSGPRCGHPSSVVQAISVAQVQFLHPSVLRLISASPSFTPPPPINSLHYLPYQLHLHPLSLNFAPLYHPLLSPFSLHHLPLSLHLAPPSSSTSPPPSFSIPISLHHHPSLPPPPNLLFPILLPVTSSHSNHPLSSILFHHPPLSPPPILLHLHPLPPPSSSTSIHFPPLSCSTSIHFPPLSYSTSIHFPPILSTSIHFPPHLAPPPSTFLPILLHLHPLPHLAPPPTSPPPSCSTTILHSSHFSPPSIPFLSASFSFPILHSIHLHHHPPLNHHLSPFCYLSINTITISISLHPIPPSFSRSTTAYPPSTSNVDTTVILSPSSSTTLSSLHHYSSPFRSTSINPSHHHPHYHQSLSPSSLPSIPLHHLQSPLTILTTINPSPPSSVPSIPLTILTTINPSPPSAIPSPSSLPSIPLHPHSHQSLSTILTTINPSHHPTLNPHQSHYIILSQSPIILVPSSSSHPPSIPLSILLLLLHSQFPSPPNFHPPSSSYTPNFHLILPSAPPFLHFTSLHLCQLPSHTHFASPVILTSSSLPPPPF